MRTVLVRLFHTGREPEDREVPAVMEQERPFGGMRHEFRLPRAVPELDGWTFRELIGGNGPSWHGWRDGS